MQDHPRQPPGDWREGLPAAEADSATHEALPSPVRAVQFDSRAVQAGDLFVCIVGERFDGHDFAVAAARAGAVAIVAQAGRAATVRASLDAGRGGDVPVVAVEDTRRALSAVAAAHEGYPARQLTVIGITGTDGKSTTAFLTLAALEGCGLRAGLLSTVESHIGGRVLPNPTRLTTQEAPVVQRLLAELVAAGCTHAIVEATSHGLALHRLDDCEFDLAVLTNLTPDHLDFHGSMEAYRAAKLRLFAMLDEPSHKAAPRRVERTAVLNADDPAWQQFARATAARTVRYGLDSPDTDVTARDIMLWSDGATFTLDDGALDGGGMDGGGEPLEASVRLPGRFNVANATAALTVAAALGLDALAAAAGIASCAGVPGRMERISGAPYEVVVDYAHTPAALEQALTTLRPLVEGRLIVVFGCAGERAPDRRGGLGAVAARLADYALLTEEDPRSEPAAAIIEQIAAAMSAAGATEGERFERVPERGAAIRRALELARAGDLVLIAGKGHEATIERADGPHPWDDRAAARAAIAALDGGQRVDEQAAATPSTGSSDRAGDER